jgi:acetyl-CoA acetyltransferase
VRAGVAIAGIAEAGVGEAPPGSTPAGLMAQATRAALADAGLPLEAVEGLLAATTQLPMAPLNLAEALGIHPRFMDGTQIGGSSPIVHLRHAAAAIEAGLCETAVIAYGSTQRLVGRGNASVQELDPQEAPFRPVMPVTAYALAASRHMHEFGTTREQLAEVAVAARAWANQTPGAYKTGPLTVEDVLAAPPICDPLGLRDCCLVTDGAAAIVVVAAERAPGAPRLLGAGEATTHRHISHMPDLVRTAAVQSGRAAFEQAGVTPQELDCAQLYDAFTITPILFLEDLGFCAKGEGGPFVSGGRIAPGGDLPVNTNGGGLSYAHPGMYGSFLITEAVRRLRGGDRLALVHGNGGVLSSQATAILGVD